MTIEEYEFLQQILDDESLEKVMMYSLENLKEDLKNIGIGV